MTVPPSSTVMAAGVPPPSWPMLMRPPVDTTLVPCSSTGPPSIMPPSTVAVPVTNSPIVLPLATAVPLTTVFVLIVPLLAKPRLSWPVMSSTAPASTCKVAPGESCFRSVTVSVLPPVTSISPAICWRAYWLLLVPTVVALVICSVALGLISLSELTTTAVVPVVMTNGLVVPSAPPVALIPMTTVEVDPGTTPVDQADAVCQMVELLFQTDSTTLVVNSVLPSPPVVRVNPSATSVPATVEVTAKVPGL